MTAMLRALAVALLLAPMPALATTDGSWRDRWNRSVFNLNQDLQDAAQAHQY